MNTVKMAVGGRPYPKDAERRVRVKVELAKRDMSVTDLARALGMKRSNVSNIINGRHRSRKNEERIAAFFGLAREELFPPRTFGDLIEMRRRANGEKAA